MYKWLKIFLMLVIAAGIYPTPAISQNHTEEIDPETGVLEVFVFHDVNGDLIANQGERGLAGVTVFITIFGTTDVAEGETDDEGYIRFELFASCYQVLEIAPEDWADTDEQRIDGVVVLAGETIRIDIPNTPLDPDNPIYPSNPSKMFIPYIFSKTVFPPCMEELRV